jgi:hypothetical protein
MEILMPDYTGEMIMIGDPLDGWGEYSCEYWITYEDQAYIDCLDMMLEHHLEDGPSEFIAHLFYDVLGGWFADSEESAKDAIIDMIEGLQNK